VCPQATSGFDKEKLWSMQLTPTVISAQPLEKAILDYLDRQDHVGLEHFLSTQRALVSAPLLTTLVDATGLAIYMLIAKLILSPLR
jgi:hypothetical protein